MHIQDLGNPEVIIYNDTVEALVCPRILTLTQHVLEPTHKLGNTLDVILTESLETIKVLHMFIGGYVSDHKKVWIEIKDWKQLPRNITHQEGRLQEFQPRNFCSTLQQQ